MTESDVTLLSIIINVILLVHNYIMHKRYDALGALFGKTIMLMGAIADGKARPERDKDGNIHMKDLRNETN